MAQILFFGQAVFKFWYWKMLTAPHVLQQKQLQAGYVAAPNILSTILGDLTPAQQHEVRTRLNLQFPSMRLLDG